MKSGMLAAEAAFDALKAGRSDDEINAYPEAFKNSWLHQELYKARNFKPWMSKGLYAGTLMVGVDQIVFGGKAPWTLHHEHADNETLKRKTEVEPIQYPKPDGVLTFDRLSSVFISNTNHEENQPVHLTLKDASIPIDVNLELYDAPEQRYCPAGSTKSCATPMVPIPDCRSMRRTASTARPATSRTRRRTLCGLRRKVAAGRTIRICSSSQRGARAALVYRLLPGSNGAGGPSARGIATLDSSML